MGQLVPDPGVLGGCGPPPVEDATVDEQAQGLTVAILPSVGEEDAAASTAKRKLSLDKAEVLFRERCPGWALWVFTGNRRLAREIGLQPAERVPLFNGKIPCELLRFGP